MNAAIRDIAAHAAGVVVDREPDFDVLAGLDVTDQKKPIGSLRNFVHVLANDARWKGRLRWSLFEEVVVFDGKPLRDYDLSKIAIWLDVSTRRTPSPRTAPDRVRLGIDAAPSPLLPTRWRGLPGRSASSLA